MTFGEVRASGKCCHQTRRSLRHHRRGEGKTIHKLITCCLLLQLIIRFYARCRIIEFDELDPGGHHLQSFMCCHKRIRNVGVRREAPSLPKNKIKTKSYENLLLVPGWEYETTGENGIITNTDQNDRTQMHPYNGWSNQGSLASAALNVSHQGQHRNPVQVMPRVSDTEGL